MVGDCRYGIYDRIFDISDIVGAIEVCAEVALAWGLTDDGYTNGMRGVCYVSQKCKTLGPLPSLRSSSKFSGADTRVTPMFGTPYYVITKSAHLSF